MVSRLGAVSGAAPELPAIGTAARCAEARRSDRRKINAILREAVLSVEFTVIEMWDLAVSARCVDRASPLGVRLAPEFLHALAHDPC